jgi:hypothetical protein
MASEVPIDPTVPRPQTGTYEGQYEFVPFGISIGKRILDDIGVELPPCRKGLPRLVPADFADLLHHNARTSIGSPFFRGGAPHPVSSTMWTANRNKAKRC